MSLLAHLPLAAASTASAPAGQPLFGSIWLALFAVIGCIAVFLILVILLGRWLAATHPDAALRPVAPPVPTPVEEPALTPEITAVIAAAVATVLGSHARIAAVNPVPAPQAASVEMLMQQWSMEGRRQIYSSHKVR